MLLLMKIQPATDAGVPIKATLQVVSSDASEPSTAIVVSMARNPIAFI